MREVPTPKAARPGWLDRVIGWISPAAGAQRLAWREAAPLLASYYRAGHRSRIDEQGSASTLSSDEILEMEREEIVERNRALERDHPSYDGLIGQAVTNVIGPSGLKPQARTPDEALNSTIESLWGDWCAGPCDVRKMSTMAELQELWFRSYLRDGDVGIVLLASGELQSIEGHLITTPGGASTDGTIVEGVQLSRNSGRPVAFHVAKSDRFIRSMETTSIPARDFIFFALRKRLGQTRGVPAITKPWLFEQYDRYLEAVVVAARVAACFGVIFKRRGGTVPGGLLQGLKDSGGNARKSFILEPGMAKYIDTDEEIEQLRPQHPGGQFGELRAAIKRDIGLPLGMPLELTDLDFSRTNYSSARASLLAAYRTFMRHQERFACCVMRRIYQWRVSKWAKDGLLGKSIPDDLWAHEWVMPRWPWVDPLKEIQAHLLAMDAGVTTLAEISASQGKDWESQLAQLARERDRREALNLDAIHSNMSRDAGDEAADPSPNRSDDE
jgi:lambda family phage portal protein